MQFPAHLEPSALRIAQHSTSSLGEIVEAIWGAHAPKSLVPEASVAASAAAAGGADRDQDAKENVGTGSQHPVSRPMIRAWLFEVRAFVGFGIFFVVFDNLACGVVGFLACLKLVWRVCCMLWSGPVWLAGS